MFWQLPSTMFLGAASAVTAGSMMIHMKSNFNSLVSNEQLSCNGDGFETCKLGGSYGNGILATNIISIVFNAVMFLTVAWTWFRNMRGLSQGSGFKLLFSLVALSVMMAVAAAGYNLYVQQNFGKEFTNGNIHCDGGTFSTCNSISGNTTNIFLGLNATAIALSGLVLLSSLIVSFNRGMGSVGREKSSRTSFIDRGSRTVSRGLQDLEKPFRSL